MLRQRDPIPIGPPSTPSPSSIHRSTPPTDHPVYSTFNSQLQMGSSIQSRPASSHSSHSTHNTTRPVASRHAEEPHRVYGPVPITGPHMTSTSTAASTSHLQSHTPPMPQGPREAYSDPRLNVAATQLTGRQGHAGVTPNPLPVVRRKPAPEPYEGMIIP